ncbi:MAG: hypothetical protein RLZZ200_2568 [Pseudomonadota bacterium]|jgi:DNA-binding response OmpR family regulator
MSTEQSPAGRLTILVVDDSPANRELLDFALSDEFDVLEADSGESALVVVQERVPDLVLLDVSMPGMGGYGLMERWRDDPKLTDVPVIFVTANTALENELRGLDLGAVDYVTKPFSIPILRARVNVHLSLRDALRRLAAQNAQLRTERDIVEGVIDRLRHAPQFRNDDLRMVMSACDAVNGDIVLSTTTASGKRWLLVGDVAGHGLPAAVVSPLLSYIFYRSARNGGELSETLDELNHVMCAQMPDEVYMPHCAVEFDTRTGVAQLWNGGLPGCFRLARDGTVEHFPSSSLPIGVLEGMDSLMETRAVQLQAGDRLYIFTDGITEAASPDGEAFGAERATEHLRTAPRDAPLDAIVLALHAFRGNPSLADDLSLVELSFRGPDAA